MVEPGGTQWMVINKFMKKWLRFVNLFYFFPILHDILVRDLRCFHFLGFGDVDGGCSAGFFRVKWWVLVLKERNSLRIQTTIFWVQKTTNCIILLRQKGLNCTTDNLFFPAWFRFTRGYTPRWRACLLAIEFSFSPKNHHQQSFIWSWGGFFQLNSAEWS